MTVVVVRTIDDWRARRRNEVLAPSVGFVPTMGALHEGHAALITRSIAENASTVVSIFVNPTQFNDPADLRDYPRPLRTDLEFLEGLGADYVFLPDEALLYPDQYRFRVTEADVSARLCGAHRPGHFAGVLTVVLKLLSAVRPDIAYFGEKDYQQYRLVRDMAAAFLLDVEIRACPIVRDSDGVALSSRNVRLSVSGRRRAAEFANALRTGATPDAVRTALEAHAIEVEYVEDWEGRRLAAVVIDGVRLIDNVRLPADTP